jgi:fructose-1,6-bisphosphatase/inositol monophosphatase family enzyme
MKSYRETLEPILRHAGELALQLRREGLKLEEKADGSMVTNADKAVSDFLMAAIAAAYPADGIVSEEHPDMSGINAERMWVIDPIDGTKHYAQGGQMFNIMVSLVEKQPIFSIIYYPVLKRWYWAEKGKGAYVRNYHQVRKLQVPAPREPYRLVYGPGSPHELGEQGTLGIGKYFSKIWHGKREAFIRVNVPYWDLIPPTLILYEAGGIVKDFKGNDISFSHPDAVQPEIIAGHPQVVAHILSKIQA